MADINFRNQIQNSFLLAVFGCHFSNFMYYLRYTISEVCGEYLGILIKVVFSQN